MIAGKNGLMIKKTRMVNTTNKTINEYLRKSFDLLMVYHLL